MTEAEAGRGAFGGERRVPWHKPGGLEAVLERWADDGGHVRNVRLDATVAAREGRFVPLPDSLAAPVRAALERRGLTQLYAHQARAFELASQGYDVVAATPTASGKSLCYNLPVLQRLSEEPGARALYMFPTKALSRDQEEALRALLRDAGLDHGAITYDGDTPGDARRAARDRSGVILTNPDMLHAGILPHHASWARLFSGLRYVVIDELHMYRGVFGSHLANVIRRLRRIARFHGSDPQFILSSATIGNPGEHASRIVGRDVAVVDENGAPAGPRRVLLYNPPVVNAELGIRQSYLKTAVRLTADLVREGVPTLVFGQSRNGVEVMLKYLRDRLGRDGIDSDAIHAYRGGYLPEARRDIERRLREGEIGCVVATNALELGIDVGALDAVVCAGYPGTVAGLWQRFGRAGRRLDPSLAVLVTSSAPLDQYVATDTDYLAGAPIEQARIDPDNVEILIQHLKCAAFELPFEQGDRFGDLPAESVDDALGFLEQNGIVDAVTGQQGKTVFHWTSTAYPANDVSLRSVGWDNYVIIDLDTDKTIAEMDWRSVHTMLHEQAIYQHAAEQWQVEKLDYDNHKGYVRKVAPDYYTTAMTHLKVSVLETEQELPLELGSGHVVTAGVGDVSVVEKVVGYKKIKYHTHENVGYGDVDLPEVQMNTTGLWLVFPEALVRSLPYERPVVVDALRGIMCAMHTVAVVGLMTDPRDLGKALGSRTDPDAPPSVRGPRGDSSKTSRGPRGGGAGKEGEGGGQGELFDPTIFLYDHIPGGVGLAPRLFDERQNLLARTTALVSGCTCDDGCPACIGPTISELDIRRRPICQALLGTYVEKIN